MKALVLLVALLLMSCTIERHITVNDHRVKNVPSEKSNKIKEKQIVIDNKCKFTLFRKR